MKTVLFCCNSMHGGLADPELFCGGADGRFVIYNEYGQIAGALLDICVHIYHSPIFAS